jgi:hypothetical protein
MIYLYLILKQGPLLPTIFVRPDRWDPPVRGLSLSLASLPQHASHPPVSPLFASASRHRRRVSAPTPPPVTLSRSYRRRPLSNHDSLLIRTEESFLTDQLHVISPEKGARTPGTTVGEVVRASPDPLHRVPWLRGYAGARPPRCLNEHQLHHRDVVLQGTHAQSPSIDLVSTCETSLTHALPFLMCLQFEGSDSFELQKKLISGKVQTLLAHRLFIDSFLICKHLMHL